MEGAVALNADMQKQSTANRRAGYRRTRASVPCVRLQGPLLPIVPMEDFQCTHPLGPSRRWHKL
eukprot:11013778-Karenia_brevis.AAC.1